MTVRAGGTYGRPWTTLPVVHDDGMQMDCRSPRWIAWRQDDHGNRAQVAVFDTKHEADQHAEDLVPVVTSSCTGSRRSNPGSVRPAASPERSGATARPAAHAGPSQTDSLVATQVSESRLAHPEREWTMPGRP
jgi:hypothetical protein